MGVLLADFCSGILLGNFCVVPLLLQIFLAKADSAAKGSEAVGILLPHPFPIVTLL